MKNILRLLVVSFVPLLALHSARGEDIVFPSDSGVLNVKTSYGAKGDGVTDDTAAIQSALSAGLDNHKIVYLPNGTYLVSNTLSWQNPAKTSNGGYGRILSMQGESRAGTIIKLANSASGYGSASTRKAVIYTASGDDQNQYNGTGEGNQAFENSIQNLTVDVGTGNPGATGVDYQVSNSGAMRNVTIRSSDPSKLGAVGVDMERRDNGPGLIQNVSIDGFQYGIAAGGGAVSAYSLEHITLTNQSIMGLWIDNAVVAVRDLNVATAPSAVSVYDQGQVTVIGGTFTGGASGSAAVSFSGGGSFGYLRSASCSGFSYLVNNNGTNVSGTSFSEYSSNGTVTGLDSTETLHLPIQETPTFNDSNLGDWISVGAASGSDDTTAIQNAMNAATATKSTVYFPSGSFNVSNTITVPNTVKHIIGCGVQIATTGSNFSDGRPMFLFSGGASTDSTVFERFFIGSGSSQLFQDTSARTLVIREIINVGGETCYSNSVNDGYLFLEDVSLSGVRIQNPQTVWARQLDTEGTSTNDLIYNNGGTLWALGNKTENGYTVVDNENGARTEDYGQLSYTFGVNSSTPNFINNNSSLTMSCAGTGFFSGATYTLLVADTQNGTTDNVPTNGQPGRTDGGVNVALFSSVQLPAVANAGFETPSAGSSAFQYNPTGGSWTFAGDSGIQSNGSAWGATNAPAGTQTAFLQGQGGANGTISQSITFPAGSFAISFQAAQRIIGTTYGTQSINVTVDGALVGSVTPTSASFSAFTTNPFTVAAGAHIVAFVGTSTSGDDTDFIDSVAINIAAPTVTVGNAGFENPSVGSAAYQYNPIGASWTFAGNSGVESNGSAWGAASSPDGTQTAFLQGQSGANGAISQNIAFPAGTFAISFQAANRYFGMQSFNVTVDGTLVGSFSPSSTSFSAFSTSAFTVAAGMHTVAFVGTSTSGDDTDFIDSVAINFALPTVTVANAGFESPSVGSASYQYNPTGSSWTFAGNAGVQSNGSAWGAANAPSGTQTAFLQGQSGANGTISQSITFPAGTFAISFQSANRYFGKQSFNVTVDGTLVGSFSPSSTSFSAFSTSSFSVAAGAHTVAFVGTSTSGDDTDFIDSVVIY